MTAATPTAQAGAARRAGRRLWSLIALPLVDSSSPSSWGP